MVFTFGSCEGYCLHDQPLQVRVDNTGTIFMSNNVQTSSHARHIRSSYVREYVEDGVIRIIFVPTGENDSEF